MTALIAEFRSFINLMSDSSEEELTAEAKPYKIQLFSQWSKYKWPKEVNLPKPTNLVILFCGNNLGLDPVRLQLFFFVLSNTINMDGSEKNFIEEQTEVSAVSNAGSTNG